MIRTMVKRALMTSLFAGLLACGVASAQGPTAPGASTKPEGEKPSTVKPAQLDELFARLAAAKDETEANGVASLIERRWARSGSDTADLLMSRANEALKDKDAALAIELLDRVIALRPDWAEAWNRRATAFYVLEDTASSMADIRQVLAREPRHFGAWAGLGQIYVVGGDKRRGLEAFRKALAIHPYLSSLRETVDRIAPEVDGRDI
jgi:tetratricopeptide (TPR) repeat protein